MFGKKGGLQIQLPHSPYSTEVASVTDWINTYYQRKCTATLSSATSGNSLGSMWPQNCSAGTLTTDPEYSFNNLSYHCYIGCKDPQYTTLASNQGHTCVGGSWSDGGTLCRRSCSAAYTAPANFSGCEQTILYESFSFNDTSLLGTQGGNAAATSFEYSPWSTTALQDPFNGFMYPYQTWPTVSDEAQKQRWQIDTVAGILHANKNNGCARTQASMIG